MSERYGKGAERACSIPPGRSPQAGEGIGSKVAMGTGWPEGVVGDLPVDRQAEGTAARGLGRADGGASKRMRRENVVRGERFPVVPGPSGHCIVGDLAKALGMGRMPSHCSLPAVQLSAAQGWPIPAGRVSVESSSFVDALLLDESLGASSARSEVQAQEMGSSSAMHGASSSEGRVSVGRDAADDLATQLLRNVEAAGIEGASPVVSSSRECRVTTTLATDELLSFWYCFV